MQPVVETVRDPDFLRALRAASEEGRVSTGRAGSILPGRTFDVTAAPMPGGGAVAVLRDQTETERVEKTRRDFIANVSHELRTPLTSIQGYTETLLDTAPEDDRDFLEVIRKNAIRMSRLTEDLLTLAQGGVRRAALRHPAGEAGRAGARGGAEFSRDRPHPRRRTAGRGCGVAPGQRRPRGHSPGFFQPHRQRAEIRWVQRTRSCWGPGPPGAVVEFYVRDFGPGISSEHLPRLFERFYRVDKARSRESGGTGLGLAIAKHIVLAHGGTIRAESELNHGSTFLFTLPTAPE